MYRCLQLAAKGKGRVSPNPMVGAVVVYQDKIIGEGYHRCCGQPHAEVNAIASVVNKELLKNSTLYVSLEPCSHYGKTPPCVELIIKHQIPHVVVACLDPYPSVSGRGVDVLRQAGIKVDVGILEQEALELNKEFITLQVKGRPYIYLKWAQSKDGFIARKDEKGNIVPTLISNSFMKMLVHKMRAETDAIMIGTNTALVDNPQLTTRMWHGKNPVRIVIDRNGRIPENSNLFDSQAETIVFTELKAKKNSEQKASYLTVDFDGSLFENIFKPLADRGIISVMIEGGARLLQTLIDQKLWDEAYVETADCVLHDGVKAPNINGVQTETRQWSSSVQSHFTLL